ASIYLTDLCDPVGAVCARTFYFTGFDACDNKTRGHRPHLQDRRSVKYIDAFTEGDSRWSERPARGRSHAMLSGAGLSAASIDGISHTGDPSSLRRCQEQNQIRNLFRLADSS